MKNMIGEFTGGRYQVVEPLGQGGMATVYKAYDTRLERMVAIKVVRPDSIPPDQLNLLLRRFEREAKAVAVLRNSRAVPG